MPTGVLSLSSAVRVEGGFLSDASGPPSASRLEDWKMRIFGRQVSSRVNANGRLLNGCRSGFKHTRPFRRGEKRRGGVTPTSCRN